MAALNENTEIPLPPVPDVNPKMPWIQLGEFESASSKTPPPQAYSPHMTGGAGMLALASARALLEHGLSGLALFDLPSAIEKGKNKIQALRTDFPLSKIITQACDVTDEKGMIAATQTAKEQLGGDLNILCCFAGMVGCVPSAEQSVDHWRKIIDVNTTGCWIAAQAVGRLAAEWTRYGIYVNTISPGYMDTVLNHGDDLASWRRIWAERNPMRRMGSPEELTGPVVLLCSDIGGSYVNGADIVVDGGGLVF
ncbi:hypothetical protein UA08_03280 [Talaromyces atroroseus]|uniref:Uncharacterized protein n=1 Tax=Talaromyces atroroseus TaxID=1441469 RepID=A0A225B539_TALAT|nr:hypothetical protein UA08_03280 [Talaromyces atroroseus]OKL61037.1 hypothetical protein UA08_03280 [Talaromyces atroroseus]